MPPSNAGLRAGVILCFVFADGSAVAAHPRSTDAIAGVRLIGADQFNTDADAYESGKRLLATADITGALAAFQRALATTPASPDALNGIGVSYDRLGRPDLARKFYEAGLAIDPASPPLLNNLGYSLYLQKDFGAAVIPLRAAAASSDPAAAAAAAATLVVLIAQAWPRPVSAEKAAPPEMRIEVTNATEQRLVLDTNEDISNAPSARDTVVESLVADEWTAADDAVLLARISADEEAEQAGIMLAEDRDPESPRPVAPTAVTVTVPEPSASGQTMAAVAGRHATAVASLLIASNDAASEALQARRRALLSIRDVALTGDGPASRATPVIFDSDDAELNAFATRVSGYSVQGRGAPETDHNRIAMRFRT